MTDDRTSPADECAATAFPQRDRTADGVTAPLPTRGARSARRGLVMEQVEIRVVRCPFAMACGQHGDAARCAHPSIRTLRSRREASLATGLTASCPGRSAGAILGRFSLVRARCRRGPRPTDTR